MYINTAKINKYPLSPEDYFKLCAIKNGDKEYIEQHLTEEDYRRFETLSLVKYVKPKNKQQPVSERVRLDKVAEKILKDITTNGIVSEEIIILVDWLIKLYKGRSNGLLKNKVETLRRLQWYSDITGIRKNRLAVLLSSFAADSYCPDSGETFQEFKNNNPRALYHNLVDNIAWAPSNNFSQHYKLEESPLEKYREENESYIESLWAKNNLENE